MAMPSKRTRLLASTILVGAVFGAGASAQAQQASSDQGTTVREVVVTGSRIRQPNLTTTSPVTTVNSQEVKLEGVQRAEDLVNSLPQVFASQASTIANGASGAANIDLRGLGCARTLVLMDGRRLMPGDPTSSCADVNNIPSEMIERVDVLTGGAAAVYGADALAGVVNFVMKKNFEGLQIDANHSFFQHSNHEPSEWEGAIKDHGYPVPAKDWSGGASTDINIMAGANAPDGKGNLTAFFGFRQTEPVTQDKFDYSACGYAAGNTYYPSIVCGGSSTGAPGRIRSQLPKPGGPAGVYVNNGGNYVLDGSATGALPAYNSRVNGYNFAPFNYFQRNDTRYTAGFSGYYKVNEHIEVYDQFNFMDDKTTAQIAGSGAFYGRVLATNCNNPLLTGAELNLLCNGNVNGGVPTATDPNADLAYFLLGRRNVEGGPRQDNLDHTSFREVLGARGDINSTWSYDVYGQYGQTALSENYQRDMSFAKIQNSLLVNPTNPTQCYGNPAGCVPWNIWQAGGVTQQALNYLETPGFASSTATEQVVDGSVTGKLGDYGVKSPWAKEGVGLVIGGEYRRESLDYKTDAEFQTGDLAGQGSPTLPSEGAYSVKELFLETRIPIISDAMLAKDLSLNGAYRRSDYTNVGSTDTYEIEANWTPVNDIRFRGSFNRAVRVPSTRELFNPPHIGLDGSSDYCAGSLSATKMQQCKNDPYLQLNPGLLGNIDKNPASQYNGYVGGNTDLRPEIGDTFSFGTVITPRFMRNFNLTIDYFDIKVKNDIGGYGYSNVQQECYVADVQAFCNMIHRQPGSGSLWLGDGSLTGTGYINDTLVNTGEQRTKGLDFQANYRLNLSSLGLKDVGHLDFNFVGTELLMMYYQPFSGALSSVGTYRCEGLFGQECSGPDGAPNPVWRHKVRATWTTPWKVTASVQWRYIGGTKLDSASSFPALVQKIDAYNYMDLEASWRVKDNLELRFGVNNVFDKDPPFPLQGASNGTTSPNVYDAMGRYFFMGLTANF